MSALTVAEATTEATPARKRRSRGGRRFACSTCSKLRPGLPSGGVSLFGQSCKDCLSILPGGSGKPRRIAIVEPLPSVPSIGEWSEAGLCAQTDPDAFFPEKGSSTREAKRICARCPVLEECREYALDVMPTYGVWAGLSERDRRRVKKQAG